MRYYALGLLRKEASSQDPKKKKKKKKPTNKPKDKINIHMLTLIGHK